MKFPDKIDGRALSEPNLPPVPRCPTCRDEGYVYVDSTFDVLSGLWSDRYCPASTATSIAQMGTLISCPDCKGNP
jgi:hypothetical protein